MCSQVSVSPRRGVHEWWGGNAWQGERAWHGGVCVAWGACIAWGHVAGKHAWYGRCAWVTGETATAAAGTHSTGMHSCCLFHLQHFQADMKIQILTRQDIDQPVLKLVDWQVCTHKSRWVGLNIGQFLQRNSNGTVNTWLMLLLRHWLQKVWSATRYFKFYYIEQYQRSKKKISLSHSLSVNLPLNAHKPWTRAPSRWRFRRALVGWVSVCVRIGFVQGFPCCHSSRLPVVRREWRCTGLQFVPCNSSALASMSRDRKYQPSFHVWFSLTWRLWLWKHQFYQRQHCKINNNYILVQFKACFFSSYQIPVLEYLGHFGINVSSVPFY